jgi:hypothetical protein
MSRHRLGAVLGLCAAITVSGQSSAAAVKSTGGLARPSRPHVCLVPHLTSLTLSRVRARLRRDGCRLGAVTTHGRPLTKLVVSRQQPAGGTRDRFGMQVNVTLVEPHVALARCLPRSNEREVISDPEAKLFVHGISYPPGSYREYAEVFRLCSPNRDSPRFNEDVAESTFSFMESSHSEFFALAGNYLAWQWWETDRYFEGSDSIQVINVATGRRYGILIGRQENNEKASQIALAANGRVAWARNLRPVINRVPVQSYAVEAAVLGSNPLPEDVQQTAFQTVFLEGSNENSLGGLHFDGNGVLHWTNGNTPHTYTFAK